MDPPPTQPIQTKVVEIRAVSASGAGVWSRVGENPICTALVAQEMNLEDLEVGAAACWVV